MTGARVGQVEHNSAAPSSITVKPNVIGVYTITCKPNGMVYVGSSKDVFGRFSGHIAKLRSGKHQRHNMAIDFAQYGESAFEFAIASVHANIDEAKEAEADLIVHYRSAGKSYNALAVRHYTPRQEDNKYARVKRLDPDFDPAAKLKAWMEINRKKVADLRAVIGRSRYSAYRVMWGGLPSYEDMGKICEWTCGQVTPNDFYDISGITAKISAPMEAAA
jgi:group I intron endonuclease